MKKKISAVLILACLATLAGCGGNGAASPATPSEHESVSEPAPETSAAVPTSGTYRMEAPEGKTHWAPELSLDQEEQYFQFYYDLLSSSGNSGTYQIEGDLLIAANNPLIHDDRQFVFRIVDSKTLAFVEDQSSQTSLQDERFGVPLYDGARFVLEEEEAAS